MTIDILPECKAHHMGLYAMEPGYLQRAVSAIRSGMWTPQSHGVMRATDDLNSGAVTTSTVTVIDETHLTAGSPLVVSTTTREREGMGTMRATVPIERDAAGVAIRGQSPAPTRDAIALISMSGPMVKGQSKFSDNDTMQARRNIRAAVRDEDVGGILLVIDSPGGMLAGTQELADDIAAAAQAKVLHAHCDDLCASAGYWAASQASFITANRSADVGSIGVYAVVEDLSEAADMAGVKVHVLSSGPLKGAGVPGTEITEELLGEVQASVMEAHGHFQDAIRSGRELDGDALEAVSTGGTFGAAQAKRMGLLDAVENMDDAVERLRKAVSKANRTAKARRSARAADLRRRLG